MNTSRQANPRSFTIRTPKELYLEISDCAILEQVPLNVKVNQLLNLGLAKHVSLNEALSIMLMKLIIETDETEI